MGLTVTVNDGGIGIEIAIDLRKDLSDEQTVELRHLFDRHGLLVFRDQDITPEDQVRVMESVGSVIDIPGDPDRRFGYVSNVRPDGTLGDRELTMHSDWSWWDTPLDAISLATVEVADGASSTRFTDNMRAWSSLPSSLRQRVEGRHARHVMNASAAPPNRRERADPERFQAVHPVVAVVRSTGAKYLYVNETATHSIEGVELTESEALLDEVFARMYEPGNQYDHPWNRGDVVMWSNRTMQHGRGASDAAHPRTLCRVVTGERSLYEAYPEMRLQHLTGAHQAPTAPTDQRDATATSPRTP